MEYNTDIFIKPVSKSTFISTPKPIYQNDSVNINSVFFKKDSKDSKDINISETSMINNRLLNIHNAILNSDYFPTFSNSNLNSNSYQDLTGGGTEFNTSSMFPTTETETFESANLPINSVTPSTSSQSVSTLTSTLSTPSQSLSTPSILTSTQSVSIELETSLDLETESSISSLTDLDNILIKTVKSTTPSIIDIKDNKPKRRKKEYKLVSPSL